MNPFEVHGIERLSPSSINAFVASREVWLMERVLKLSTPVGAAAHRGTASEDGIVAGLMDPTRPIEECIAIAQARYRNLTGLSRDPNRQKEYDAIPGIVTQGVKHLRPYGVPTDVQGKIEYRFEDVAVPLIGYYDVRWQDHGIITDIKTQLRLAHQITSSHARQLSLYKAALSDNLDARITYLTPTKAATYQLENHREHLEAMRKIALTIQRFLALSDDPQELVKLLCPNYDHYFFNDPATRQKAYELWKY